MSCFVPADVFFSSRRRHTIYWRDWSSDVCSSDLESPPKNWDELRQYSEQLTSGDKYGMGITSSKHLYTDQEFYTFMITNGGKELFAEDGSVAFDTPSKARRWEARSPP